MEGEESGKRRRRKRGREIAGDPLTRPRSALYLNGSLYFIWGQSVASATALYLSAARPGRLRPVLATAMKMQDRKTTARLVSGVAYWLALFGA